MTIDTAHTPGPDGSDGLSTPWSLCFKRDGTEDVAVICDVDGDAIVRTRCFWLPDAHDPVPPTLRAVRLMRAAPDFLIALKQIAVYAENGAYCLESPEAEAEAEAAWSAVEAALKVIAQMTADNDKAVEAQR